MKFDGRVLLLVLAIITVLWCWWASTHPKEEDQD